MNTETMELNLEEMKMVTGGWDWKKGLIMMVAGGVLGGTACGMIAGVPGAAIGGTVGAAWGAASTVL